MTKAKIGKLKSQRDKLWDNYNNCVNRIQTTKNKSVKKAAQAKADGMYRKISNLNKLLSGTEPNRI